MSENLYVDLGGFAAQFANYAELNIKDAREIERTIERASRFVDAFCSHGAGRRHFYPVEEKRLIRVERNTQRLWLPWDLLSIVTLKTDDDRDRTFETTWAAATDYFLRPRHQGFGGADGPFTHIERDRQNNVTVSWFPFGEEAVELDGVWGYGQAVEDTGDTVQDNPWTDSSTVLTVGDSSRFRVGQTLKIILASGPTVEQVYVDGLLSSTTLSVVRGRNGSTASPHLQGTVIERYVYIPPVTGATIIQAGRLWERRKTAFATTIIDPNVGAIEVLKDFDPDAARMLREAGLVRKGVPFA
jgi:hypothetical protein